MRYVDYIAIRPELIVEGEPTGLPDPLPGVAATVGGTRVFEGHTEFLCRIRGIEGELPVGLDLPTEDEFREENGALWRAFGMDSYEIEDEDGETIIVTPQVPVFL